MARLRRTSEAMSVNDLGELLVREIPLPDPMQDREEWHAVMQLRYRRGAELGFDELEVIRGQLCARLGPLYPGYESCQWRSTRL